MDLSSASKRPSQEDDHPAKRPRVEPADPTIISALMHITCMVCNKLFSRQTDLTRHIKATHGNEVFNCPSCTKTFTRNDNLDRHLKIHSKTFPCDQCDQTFHTKPEQKAHKDTYHGNKTFDCTTCSKTLKRKDDLTRHQKTHYKTYSCNKCQHNFNTKPELTTHMELNHGNKTFNCPTCSKTFKRKDSLTRHQSTHSKTYQCTSCDQSFPTRPDLKVHKQSHTQKQPPAQPIPLNQQSDPSNYLTRPSTKRQPSRTQSALRRATSQYTYDGSPADVDVTAFLRDQNHEDILEDTIRRENSLKFYISVNVLFRRLKNWTTRGDQETNQYFSSRCDRLLQLTNIEQQLERAYAEIAEKIANWLKNGSGWTIDHIIFSDLNTVRYQPLRAGGSENVGVVSVIYEDE